MDNNQISEEELNNMSEDQLLDLFVDQMLRDKGLADNPDTETYREMHEDLKQKLIFEVNRAVLASMPDDKFDELNARMENEELDSDTILQAVKDAGVDIDQVTETAMKDFREVFLNGAPAEEASAEEAAEAPAENNTEE